MSPLLVAVLVAFAQSADSLPKDTLASLKRSTVYLKVGDQSGSGLVIRKTKDKTWILTSRHVLNKESPKYKINIVEDPRSKTKKPGGPPSKGHPLPGGSGPKYGIRPIPKSGNPSRPSHPFDKSAPKKYLVITQLPTMEHMMRTAEVVFHSGTEKQKSLTATLLVADVQSDLALVEAGATDDSVVPIPLASEETFEELQTVFFIGFPFGEMLTRTKGKTSPSVTKASISSLRNGDDGTLAFIQINGDVNPGNSGGPLIDANGKLIGVICKHLVGTQIGMAVALPQIVEFLKPRIASVEYVKNDKSISAEPKHTAKVAVHLVNDSGTWKSVRFIYNDGPDVRSLSKESRQSGKAAKEKVDLSSVPSSHSVELTVVGDTATGDFEFADDKELCSQIIAVHSSGKTEQTIPAMVRIPGLSRRNRGLAKANPATPPEMGSSEEDKRRDSKKEDSPNPKIKREGSRKKESSGERAGGPLFTDRRAKSTPVNEEPQVNSEDGLLDTPATSPSARLNSRLRARSSFRDVGVENGILVGLRISKKANGGGIAAIQPIYRIKDKTKNGAVVGLADDEWVEEVAKPGFAIGKLECRAGLWLDSFVIVYMKIDGEKLDPNDVYQSKRFGSDGGSVERPITGAGKLVRGIHGEVRSEIRSIGLVLQPPAVKTEPKSDAKP